MWTTTNCSEHCIYIFNHQNQLIKMFGSNGGFAGQFEYPVGVTFDNDNNMQVSDLYNHRVQKFNTGGNYLLQYGGRGAEDGQIANPHGISAWSDKV